MSLHSPHQEVEIKTSKIHLINPSIQEFKTTYLDDNNDAVEVILAPLETRAFSQSEGKIVLTQLINFILNQSGFSYKSDVNLEKAAIREKCIIYE